MAVFSQAEHGTRDVAAAGVQTWPPPISDGRMKDLSGHANHGTITGTTDIVGKVGRAGHFNAGDRITAPPIPVPATAFTVAACFRWPTNPWPNSNAVHRRGGSWDRRVLAA